MGEIKSKADSTYRDFVTDGVPASGEYDPPKVDIRALFALVETVIASAAAGLSRYATVALMQADNSGPDGELAYVFENNGSTSDPANGVYQRDGVDGDFVAAPWYFDAVAAVVQPLVDAAEAAADAAEAAALATAERIVADTLRATLLAISGSNGQSLAVVTGAGELASAVFPAWIASLSDRVLYDLLASGAATWRGPWASDDVYSRGQVVQVGTDVFGFCYADVARSLISPVDDPTHWAMLELVNTETYAFFDDFNASPGTAQGRAVERSNALVWSNTGQGTIAPNQNIVTGGYMTANENTYFTVGNLPGRLTEFGCRVRLMATPALATMAISPNANFSGSIFNPGMWHVNWYQNFVGDTQYWDADDGGATFYPGAEGTYKFFWRRAPIGGFHIALKNDAPNECVMKIRGSFNFGYLDGRFMFVELHDKIGKLAGNGNAKGVFLQNHVVASGGSAGALGNERQERAWVKVTG